MADALPPDVLAPLLRDRRALIAAVLEDTYADARWKMTLDILEFTAHRNQITVAEILSDTLARDDLTARFAAVLRNRDPDLLPLDAVAPAPAAAATAVLDQDADPQAVARFTAVAHARRCLISIRHAPQGPLVPRGSGLLVGRRLVLTAAHVIADILQAPEGPAAPRLVVRDAAGTSHAAWAAFVLPVHDRELLGQPAPRAAYLTHADVALLRLFSPIGRAHRFGHFDIDAVVPPGLGTWRLWMLHFPQGADIGYTITTYRRQAPDDMYLEHAAGTAGGSSGGAGFSGDFRYLGHHQAGKTGGNGGRIVPYERYAAHDGFRAQLGADNPPDYLWSIDETPEGHFIIGRRLYFDALCAIVEGTVPNLRGIWVRRIDAGLPAAGLGFGYRMLTAHLRAYDSPDRTHRLSSDLITADLLGDVQARILGTDRPLRAVPGDAPDETSLAVAARDRAIVLADRLEAHAAAAGLRHWLYFDNPPSGLSQEAQVQMEHLVSEILTRDHLRIVLSGFETFTVRAPLYGSIADARDRQAPGLLVEHIGEFTRDDVRETVAAMSDSLGLNWAPDVVDHAVTVALGGLASTAGVFPGAVAGTVAEALRAQVRLQGVGAP